MRKVILQEAYIINNTADTLATDEYVNKEESNTYINMGQVIIGWMEDERAVGLLLALHCPGFLNHDLTHPKPPTVCSEGHSCCHLKGNMFKPELET